VISLLGIAAIVGAGIFSTIGKASADGGPVVIFYSYLLQSHAVCCFAYAEFARWFLFRSAYTYSYVAFGEIIAWIGY
jgi:amino acid permease